MKTLRPVFEIEEWPESELEWWAAFFSIDANKDKPIIKYRKSTVSVVQSISDLKEVLR
jgi:hypothetical protein